MVLWEGGRQASLGKLNVSVSLDVSLFDKNRCSLSKDRANACYSPDGEL